MANAISINVYEFSTGLDWNGQRYLKTFQREQIVSVDPHSIYNSRGQYFTGVRAAITSNPDGVIRKDYVAETVAQVVALINA